jgi:ribosome biogenesis GTPase
MIRGVIGSTHRRGVTVLVDGVEHWVRFPGRLLRDSGPAAGDLVELEETPGGFAVNGVLPRRNTLERSDQRTGARVIAANIDLAVIFMSIVEPDPRRGFIDRCAASASWRSIPSLIAVNKMDLAGEEGARVLAGLERDYAPAGLPVVGLSCTEGTGTDRLLQAVRGLTVAVAGPSGAGKTTFVSLMGARLDLGTGPVNEKTGKGRHTTVAARLVPAAGGTLLLDTPGLKVFAVDHIPRDMLHSCFGEFRRFEDSCRFRDCMHSAEPGCAVREAVEAGHVPASRYESYLGLLEESPG